MIALRNVSKRFKLYRRPSDRILEWLRFGPRHQEFHALSGINLEVPRGRTVGIIGANGAGKSTLLKLVTGTLLPTEGTIEIDGRIAALLELGTGFHPDFTGRQNIYINGQLLGLSHEELNVLEPEIIEFSELGPFIDQPLRTYSSGMVVRLGFSVAAAINPDVLIIDEALSVGDARFAQKCTRRIQEFKERGTTILFVSHDPSAILSLCDEAVLLEGGRIRSRGLPKDVLEEYNALLAAKGSGNVALRISRETNESGVRRHGTFEALITRLETCNAEGKPAEIFHPGDVMRLRLRVCFLNEVSNPGVGFVIKDRLGLSLYGTNTVLKQIAIGACRPGDAVDVEATIPLNLGYGDYSVTVAVHDDETHLDACYEWIDQAAIFRVRHRGKPDWTGVTLLGGDLSATRQPGEAGEVEKALSERFPEWKDPMDAAGVDPSPFLSGAGRLRHDDGGNCRPIEGRLCFVFRPSQPALHLKIRIDDPAGDGRTGCRFKLSSPGTDWQSSITMDRPAGWLHFPLPTAMPGRTILFHLDIEGLAPPCKPLLYEIRSASPPQETVEWPIMMPVKS